MDITLKEIQVIAEELRKERLELKKRWASYYEEHAPDDQGFIRGMDALMNRITERIEQ